MIVSQRVRAYSLFRWSLTLTAHPRIKVHFVLDTAAATACHIDHAVNS